VRTIQCAVLVCLVGLLVDARPMGAEAGELHPPIGQSQDTAGSEIAGKVVSTMNAASYTYVEVDTGDAVVWAAAPRTEVTVGDRVFIPGGMPMPDFYSPTLDRRFEVIYFAPVIRVHGANPGSAHGAPAAGAAAAEPDFSGIERPAGGMTVAELREQKADLGGKEVTLRGKVVKYNAGIMGKTWIHVRDGTSGPEGGNDVTVTTTSTDASLGDVVLVRGVVALDKDFGYGYQYDLLIEDATVTNE
jgi:hypothetical protein